MAAEAFAAARVPLRIDRRADAVQLVDAILALLRDLEGVLEAETAHVRVGRIREGLTDDGRKGELGTRYMAGLETVKANAVALARLAPDALETLRQAHARFGCVVQMNQTVLATARAVTEGLIRGLADDLGRATRPSVYGASGAMVGASGAHRTEPVVLSRRL